MSHDPEPTHPSDPTSGGTAAPIDVATQRLVMSDAVALAGTDPGGDAPDATDATDGTEPRVVDTAVTTLGDAEIGLWQVEPGVLHDVEVDEVFLVLAGAGSVTFADGSVLALHPGVLVHLREGDRTVWEITETLRKLYVAHAG